MYAPVVVYLFVPVRALVVLVDDFHDEVAGGIDEYSASGLYSNSHLVDRFRLVRPSNSDTLSRIFDLRRPRNHATTLHSHKEFFLVHTKSATDQIHDRIPEIRTDENRPVCVLDPRL